MNRALPRIGEPAWRALEAHPWPGNVRELGNVMERLVIYHAGRDVEPADLGLPQSLRASLFPYNVPQAAPSEGSLASVAPSGRIRRAPYAPDSVSDLHRVDSARADRRVRAAAPVASAARRRRRSPPEPLSLDLPEGGTTFDDLEREILAQVLRAPTTTSPAPPARSG